MSTQYPTEHEEYQWKVEGLNQRIIELEAELVKLKIKLIQVQSELDHEKQDK